MTRAIGLAALTVLELPHHEQVSVAAEAGYSHVGLRLVPVVGQPYQYPLELPEVERRLGETGVRVLDVEYSGSRRRRTSRSGPLCSRSRRDSRRLNSSCTERMPTRRA